jgi:hypothetical protein
MEEKGMSPPSRTSAKVAVSNIQGGTAPAAGLVYRSIPEV